MSFCILLIVSVIILSDVIIIFGVRIRVLVSLMIHDSDGVLLAPIK